MNVLTEYFGRTISGIEQCFSQDKTMVLVLAALLILWLTKVKGITKAGERMLVYTTVMSGILLCPFTAVCVVVYQSAFYDYEWAWSMVPVLVVIAYSMVLLWDANWKQEKRKQKIPVLLGVLVLVFFCGNQGRLKLVDATEANARANAEEIVACLEIMGESGNTILWAPKDIMQEVRRSTGEIKLVYGRDMWDAKSGAYDYEAYSPEFEKAYEWMEMVDVLATESEEHVKEYLFETYHLDKNVSIVVEHMLLSGVNSIVLPRDGADFFDEDLRETVETAQMSVEKIYVGQYAIYLLK